MATKTRRDWSKIDPLIDNLKAQGWNDTQIAKDLGIGRQTLVDHLRSRDPGTPTGHQSTPEHIDIPNTQPNLSDAVHPGTPGPTESSSDEQYTQEHHSTLADAGHTEVHPGTLEGHQEVMEDVSQSVPDAPHIGTEEPYQNTLEHLSTPEVHPEVSQVHSSTAHSGVPARQDHLISTPIVHPGTPTEEDWQLWHTIKARWLEVEVMLAERHTRQALLSTPAGTPRHTVEKTYVVDTFYVELIDRYAKEHNLDLKDVLNFAFQRFFQQEGYLRQ
jgi:hypothetical protein